MFSCPLCFGEGLISASESKEEKKSDALLNIPHDGEKRRYSSADLSVNLESISEPVKSDSPGFSDTETPNGPFVVSVSIADIENESNKTGEMDVRYDTRTSIEKLSNSLEIDKRPSLLENNVEPEENKHRARLKIDSDNDTETRHIVLESTENMEEMKNTVQVIYFAKSTKDIETRPEAYSCG